MVHSRIDLSLHSISLHLNRSMHESLGLLKIGSGDCRTFPCSTVAPFNVLRLSSSQPLHRPWQLISHMVSHRPVLEYDVHYIEIITSNLLRFEVRIPTILTACIS